MVENFIELMKGLPEELIIFVISLLPVLELRGGMLAAALLDVPWLKAFIICLIGNILPIPFILLFLRKIFNFCKKIPGIRRIILWLEKHGSKKGNKLNKGLEWGLFTLVALPLPGTGGWTGALVATMMNIRIKKSFPIIFAGVIAAGVIMSVLSYFIPDLFF